MLTRSVKLNRRSLENSRIRVLVADNDTNHVKQHCARMEVRSDIEVVGGAINREEALQRLLLLEPDVVVININFGYRLGGIDIGQSIRRFSPTTAIVMVSPYRTPEYLSFVPSGLSLDWSYILVETANQPGQLAEAVSRASWGLQYMDPSIDHRSANNARDWVEETVKEELYGGWLDKSNRIPSTPTGWSRLDRDSRPDEPKTQNQAAPA